jgi:hypothetical protein
MVLFAKDEPAERWCVANECRKACGCKAGIFVLLLIRLIASTLFSLKYDREQHFERKEKELLSIEISFVFKYSRWLDKAGLILDCSQVFSSFFD